jgi:hypothetical protein
MKIHLPDPQLKRPIIESYMDSFHTPVQWFQNQISRVASNLRVRPSADTVEHEGWFTVKDPDHDIVKGCPLCSDEWMVDLMRFWCQMEADIKRLNVAFGESATNFARLELLMYASFQLQNISDTTSILGILLRYRAELLAGMY